MWYSCDLDVIQISISMHYIFFLYSILICSSIIILSSYQICVVCVCLIALKKSYHVEINLVIIIINFLLLSLLLHTLWYFFPFWIIWLRNFCYVLVNLSINNIIKRCMCVFVFNTFDGYLKLSWPIDWNLICLWHLIFVC
jgi:hypothetical protein